MISILKKLKHQSKLFELYKFVTGRIEEAQLKQVASTLTLTTILSIVPAIAVIMAAFAAFPLFATYRESLEQFLFSTLLPEQYSVQIMGYIKEFAEKATGLTIFGVIGLGVSAILCIATIDEGLNRTFQVKHLRNWVSRFLLYWALLTLGPVILAMSLAASSYVTGLAVMGKLTAEFQWIYQPVQALIQGVILACLYKYVPNCRVLWKDAIIGGCVTATVMAIFRWGFGVYILRGSYTTIYGAFAAIPVLLTWMYIMWMLVLGGAALTATLPMLRATRYSDFNKTGNKLLSAVALIKLLYEAKQSGNPIMTDIELADKSGSYPNAVDHILSRLLAKHYVVRIGEKYSVSWALLVDGNKATLKEVFEEFAVDTSNSLLTSDETERVWIESGLNDQWLNTPIAQIFSK